MNIGIGFTTFNRPQTLKRALENVWQNKPEGNIKMIVVDDHSTPYLASMNEILMAEYPEIEYTFNQTRKGIANSKNVCLSYLKNCDYIFLFDDDTFPIFKNWHLFVINAHKETNIHHFNYIKKGFFNIVPNGIKYNNFIIEKYPHGSGVMLFITKEVLKKVGGLNPNFGLWGDEHISYSHRINNAGLTNKQGPFLSIKGLENYICALDFEDKNYTSSMTYEEKIKSQQSNNLLLMEDIKGSKFYNFEQNFWLLLWHKIKTYF